VNVAQTVNFVVGAFCPSIIQPYDSLDDMTGALLKSSFVKVRRVASERF
jgi:hypothetical protein